MLDQRRRRWADFVQMLCVCWETVLWLATPNNVTNLHEYAHKNKLCIFVRSLMHYALEREHIIINTHHTFIF